MQNLSTYNFSDSISIRSINKDNEYWFVAADICKGLEIADAAQAVRQIKNQLDECKIKGTFSKRILIKTNGGNQNTTCINEAGVNLLIMQSRKKEAMPFKWWVASEVLPSIRKTGSYSLTINTQQQHKIKEAVYQNVSRTGRTFQAVYHDLYNRFQIPKYQDLLTKDFDAAIEYLEAPKAIEKKPSYLLDIPFDLRLDRIYKVTVRNGQASRCAVMYASLQTDYGTAWAS